MIFQLAKFGLKRDKMLVKDADLWFKTRQSTNNIIFIVIRLFFYISQKKNSGITGF